jgi:HrpA-like RNA helicase
VCPGTVVRLYPEEFLENAMEPYDPPEMLVQPLERVVLRMKMLSFGNIREMLQECVQPPNLEQVDNALDSLARMGALMSSDEEAEITNLGHILISLGLDLQIARMVSRAWRKRGGGASLD